MTLVIAFAKMDLMAVNVISVKKDSQATNAMNANLISLVTTVINASLNIRRGPKLEGCAFANFGNSSGARRNRTSRV